MAKDKKTPDEIVKTDQPETQVTEIVETTTEEVAPVNDTEIDLSKGEADVNATKEQSSEQPEEKAETKSPAESTDEAVEFEWQQHWDPMAHSFKKRLVPKKK